LVEVALKANTSVFEKIEGEVNELTLKGIGVEGTAIRPKKSNNYLRACSFFLEIPPQPAFALKRPISNKNSQLTNK